MHKSYTKYVGTLYILTEKEKNKNKNVVESEEDYK